jgi:hypothetical protein
MTKRKSKPPKAAQERRKVIDYRRRIAAELRRLDNDYLAATELAELAELKGQR